MQVISVVIPTFNSNRFIGPCLDSLFAQDYRGLEAIVVDNNSQDDTAALVRKNYPMVNLIQNKHNLGPCKARNQGIGRASGDWILTLDCDTVLDKNFISRIQEAIRDLPARVGMIQPKILQAGGKTIYSCGISLSFLRRFYDINRDKADDGEFNKPKYIFGACSAAAIYRMRMLQELKEDTGYFDERFFFLAEDVDLSWRAKNQGWKALFCPQAVCSHYGDSSGFDKKLRQYLCWRNRYYTIIKNEGWMMYSARIIPLLFYDLPRLAYLVFTNKYAYKRPDMIFG
ncbi:MAG: glycosyltransferase family 2 protein [Candidatus Omnitrophica bacterium]|nr:glycosyltransferase family 2 protein [Candidatus Omnitrophota bacterium]